MANPLRYHMPAFLSTLLVALSLSPVIALANCLQHGLFLQLRNNNRFVGGNIIKMPEFPYADRCHLLHMSFFACVICHLSFVTCVICYMYWFARFASNSKYLGKSFS